ncbi:MAG: tRNA modification GTPase [Planctomycetes bacterium]|nr:tRNA modification GTPase [Planctomycetota bacterium]
MYADDTIAALASAAGPGPRGILRVSGPQTRDVLATTFRPDDERRWRMCRAAARHVGRLAFEVELTADARRPLQIDAAVYLWPGRRSYTGEPAAEVHMPGSPPLLEAVLSELFRAGARPASPGEFTLRAFLAGRLDLAQAEAVLGVVDAADRRELESALAQLAGGLSGRIASLRSDLLDLLADIEAGLDFVDEDIEFIGREHVVRRLSAAESVVAELLEQARGRMQSTGRQRIVLAGVPNAGKSTLFNSLVGRDAALVSHVAGTTRDYLSATLQWHGLEIELVDTAGWDDAADALLRQARALGREQSTAADLVLLCVPKDAAGTGSGELLAELRGEGIEVFVVETKADLPEHFRSSRRSTEEAQAIAVSALTSEGLNELTNAVVRRLSDETAGRRQLVGSTAARGRESLETARGALAAARTAAELAAGDEFIVLDIRQALDHLGRIVGTVYTDDLLDRIFSRFCIGK